MSSNTETLLGALQTSDMLEVDGLHAWDFNLDAELLAQSPTADNASAPLLSIDCMDGRTRRYWNFTREAVEAARFDGELQSWLLLDPKGEEHRIVCMAAFSSGDDDEDEVASDDDGPSDED